MLYDAINVFEKMLNAQAGCCQSTELDETKTEQEHRIKLLVDNYIPKDGTYILINMDKDFQCEDPLEIRFDKKSGDLYGKSNRYYNYIKYLDYNSKLIEMNKPINGKVIHSNQIFSFWVKKESIVGKKLTEEVVNGYYNTLRSPEMKYTKSEARKLYERAAAELGEPDLETLEKINVWIKGWLMNLELLPVDYSGKDYLKLFFVYDDEKTKELYEKENRRYLIPNIYNSNDYNVNANGTILGMPSNKIIS